MDKKLLGKRINIARKERCWTSERLSEACNINATYLRQIESGTKVPSLQVFVLLCEALKVSPTYLLAEVLPSMELQNMVTVKPPRAWTGTRHSQRDVE